LNFDKTPENTRFPEASKNTDDGSQKVFWQGTTIYTGNTSNLPCNLEEICDTLMNQNYFQMQHFISESNWSHRDVIDTAAKGFQ